MIDIVVLHYGVAEHPEVINTGKEVDDAEGVVTGTADVCQHVNTSDLDPVLLEHQVKVLDLGSTACIVHSIVLLNFDTFEKVLKEERGDRLWDHRQSCTCGEDGILAIEPKSSV